jgi:hypothetical protein
MQSVLHLVDRYTKSPIVIPTASEGSAFAQNGGKDGKGGTRRREPYSKTHWKDQYCHTCKKKGHPTKHCPNKNDRKNDDDKSRSSKSSNKSSKSKSSKVNASELKRLKKQFATFDNDLKELTPDDSDISDSSDGEEASNFQYEEPSTGFQMMQLDVVSHDIQGVPTEQAPVLQQSFDNKGYDEILFKQKHGKLNKLNLRNIILLDSQSTMDLFCNSKLVDVITKASSKMRLKSNDGTMAVTHKATMTGYKHDVWFSEKAITNIIALKNLRQQYQITYDSRDKKFVVHRDHQHKPNMEFKMHESGLHYYDPNDEGFVFVNTVSGNKEGFSQKQLKGAELARTLYATLAYPSQKDFKWAIQSNQIQDCPVTSQDIEVTNKIWGNTAF